MSEHINLYDALQAEKELDNLQDENGEYRQVIETTKKEIVDYQIKVIRNDEETVESIKREIERLKSFQKHIEHRIDRRKAWIRYSLESNGAKKAEGNLGRINIRKTTSVGVTDISQVPKEYLSEKVTVSVDKKAVKEAFKEIFRNTSKLHRRRATLWACPATLFLVL